MNFIKELSANNYDEIFALSQFAFQYVLTEEERKKKKEEAERHKIWGVMDNDKIAAKLHLIPLSVYIHGREFKMGGISSVATWPEYRRKGMVKDLLLHALRVMKEEGQTVSYLHPFSVPFYRQFGWEIAFSKKCYDIPMTNLKKQWEGNGYVKRIDKDIPLLQKLYTPYIQKYNGALIRDEKWWMQRVLRNESVVAAAFNENDEAEGYLIYTVKDDLVKVEELVYLSLNGLNVLLQFISNHDSMAKKVEMVVAENDNLPQLVDEPRFEQKLKPYFMARIVDVHFHLKQYFEHISMNGGSLHLFVEDTFLPENTGTYTLAEVDGKINVSFSSSTKGNVIGIRLTVQQLASILFGYKRPMELYELGLVKGNEQDIDKLEQIIPRKQTYFPDFF
ncbi:GNAT family N-acetyltransferase [Oceanobacillus salinisoli]|uniref:GNAT family N-acetyltransferase n=1 Tax=Oceanobacillus salinisoli TaxID=2678611 RepID=UPI0012E13EAB|nr:GNAT family N-acetyltransferase [Oceanobacillus salinisoli]